MLQMLILMLVLALTAVSPWPAWAEPPASGAGVRSAGEPVVSVDVELETALTRLNEEQQAHSAAVQDINGGFATTLRNLDNNRTTAKKAAAAFATNPIDENDLAFEDAISRTNLDLVKDLKRASDSQNSMFASLGRLSSVYLTAKQAFKHELAGFGALSAERYEGARRTRDSLAPFREKYGPSAYANVPLEDATRMRELSAELGRQKTGAEIMDAAAADLSVHAAKLDRYGEHMARNVANTRVLYAQVRALAGVAQDWALASEHRIPLKQLETDLGRAGRQIDQALVDLGNTSTGFNEVIRLGLDVMHRAKEEPEAPLVDRQTPLRALMDESIAQADPAETASATR